MSFNCFQFLYAISQLNFDTETSMCIFYTIREECLNQKDYTYVSRSGTSIGNHDWTK